MTQGPYGVGACAKQAPVGRYRDAGDGNVVFWDELLGALIFAQIPEPYTAAAIASDDFALVWVNYYVVDSNAVVVAPLNGPLFALPHFDESVLRTGHQPFRVAMESDPCDIACVSIKFCDGLRICGADVVELDIVITGSGQHSLVRRDAKAIYLGVRMLNSARANARERFPEANGVIIAS